MSLQGFVSVADFGQSLTLALALCAYVPQWLTLYRNRSSDNMSLKAWCMWLFSGFLTWFYAFVHFTAHGTHFVLLITSSAAVLFMAATIALILRYRKDPKEEDEPIVRPQRRPIMSGVEYVTLELR